MQTSSPKRLSILFPGLLQIAWPAFFFGLLTFLPASLQAKTADPPPYDDQAYAAPAPNAPVRLASLDERPAAGYAKGGGEENSVGIYIPDGFADGPKEALAQEASLGRKINILSFYEAWGNERRPDIAGIELCLKRGFVPMITWEPWKLPGKSAHPEKQPDYSLSALLSGRYDGYIRTWAIDLKQLSSPIFLRPMHEMNGNWYPWCGKVNGNKPEEYVAAWHHIRSIFREVGCDKVLWVWSPNAQSVPRWGNDPEAYFPGKDEVDCLALDGYNWGTTQEWSQWQTFEEVFSDGYERLTRLGGGKPLMIAEAGCAEQGGDKGLWIRGAARTLKDRFPAVKAVVWFNVNKECDWRIESSEKSLVSFRTNFREW